MATPENRTEPEWALELEEPKRLPEFDLLELASTDGVPHTAPFDFLGAQAAAVAQPEVLASSSADPAGALMDGLHEEFIRVLQDPAELASRSRWTDAFVGTEGEPAPSLDALSREAAAFAMARDILIPVQPIGQVIDGFNPAGPCDPPGLDAPEDVLQLFAPPESGASAKGRLPSLTLREHHALSPDSHFHIGQATQSMKGKPE